MNSVAQSELPTKLAGWKNLSRFKFAVLSLLSLLIAACSPELNWRQVQGEHAPYQLLLPGKPAQASKTIQLANQQREMHMQGTQVAGIQFVIAHVGCGNDEQAQILAAMRQGLIQNLHANQTQLSSLSGEILQIKSPPPQTQIMWVKLFARQQHCYQMLMLTQAGEVPQEVRETFFDSFKSLPLQQPAN